LPNSKKKKLLRIQKKLAKDPNFVPTISPPKQKCLEEFIAENDSVSISGVQKLRVSSHVNSNRLFFKYFI